MYVLKLTGDGDSKRSLQAISYEQKVSALTGVGYIFISIYFPHKKGMKKMAGVNTHSLTHIHGISRNEKLKFEFSFCVLRFLLLFAVAAYVKALFMDVSAVCVFIFFLPLFCV